MTDNEIIRDVLELFLVQYFDNIGMSGSVKFKKHENINYFSIDLNDIGHDENIDKLHQALSKYTSNWVKLNGKSFNNYLEISNITVEYLLPEKDGTIQNQSKHLTLFRTPHYYFQNKKKSPKPLPKAIIWIMDIWYNIVLRNTIIVSVITLVFILLSFYIGASNNEFQERLAKSFDYVNIASGIIASFALAFITSKVVSIRSQKLNRTNEIKRLCNQLTYFRNICYNFSKDHVYWSQQNKFYNAYQHANSIKDKISYKDYCYPDYDDEIKYAKFNSHYNKEVSNGVVTLILQMEMMAGNSFIHSDLTYTEFPPNYIYSLDEMEEFTLFCNSNLIWYCSSEMKMFPQTFSQSYAVQEILKDTKRIYPEKTDQTLTSKLLEEISLDFQYKIIPQLFRLTKLNESRLPISIRYFVTMFILLLAFGIIIPTITFIFFEGIFSSISVFVVVGIISHILLTLKSILSAENTLNRKVDYI